MRLETNWEQQARNFAGSREQEVPSQRVDLLGHGHEEYPRNPR
jgi:hypothetical protein